ncbi:efflux RND transporter permease subunit [Prolixibacteraceae bacterium JC049]|nr:efflux RND transporter permease subunit [Prolixibacteraceae bacterium JC049]
MKKLIEQFVKFPFYANLIIVALIIGGFWSVTQMKKSFFPEITSKFINVSVSYPGASPQEMEEGVTARIEEAIRGIVGIREITSTSSENFARVSIETTGEYDIDETLIEVKNAVDGISSFPTAAERPIVAKRRTRSMALFMSVTGDVDLLTLKQYAQQVEEDFLSSGIVSQVSVVGYPPLEISVEVNEANLLRYGVTFSEIANAIASNNRDVSGGQIRSMEEEMLIRLRSRSADPNKLADIIIKGNPEGGYIRIRDIGEVKKKFADVSSKALVKGKPLVTIMINKLIEEDLKDVSDYCENYAKEFNTRNLGVKLNVDYSFYTMLKARLKMLYNNGLLGFILVIIALTIFLSFRLSFWVAWGIPSSFLGMFIIANMLGLTINMISLFGMILVIGILVDDGIVIGENIYQHFERGKTARKAAIDGTIEVLPAVVTSVTTTIIAFSPILFLTGRMEMLREMAFVVILSLALSLVEAFFVLPAHLGNHNVMRRKNVGDNRKGFRKILDNGFLYLREKIYGPALRWILDWRYLALGFPLMLVLITAGLVGGGMIKTTFFPRVEFDQFQINIAFTPGSGEGKTAAYMERFEKAVWEVNEEMLKERPDTVDYIDNCFVTIGSAFNGQETGAHAGSINVFPRDLEGTGISNYQIIQRVRKKIGDQPEAEKFTVGGTNRWGAPVSISLLGKNNEELEAARDFLIQELEKMPQLKDVVDNNALGKQEVRLKLKPKAYLLGLNESTIANQVRQAFYGGQAQRLQEGRDELRIWVRYPKYGRERLGQMERMKVKTPQGEYPLTELVEYNIERGPVNIRRYNGKREIRVEAETVDPDASVTDILAEVNSKILPRLKAQFHGISLENQGQSKESSRTMNDIMSYFAIAFMMIILILMIHFKSFEQPFLILIMIPLSILGALWGHGLHGKPVSLLSLWGIIALSGVIINDAVVFLSRYNDLIVEGMKVKAAVIAAGKSRLRPIILTTLTTSIGLYPLILEKSFQAQFLIPMAISLVYGVAFGTMFILVFFPALIVILNDIRKIVRETWHGRKFEREDVEVAKIHSLTTIHEEEEDE